MFRTWYIWILLFQRLSSTYSGELAVETIYLPVVYDRIELEN